MRMRARTQRRYGRVTPVAWGEVVPVREQQPRERGAISRAHKERILAELVLRPEGVRIADLAGLVRLSQDRTYQLIDELRVEGLVDKFGRGREVRWVANV